MRTNESDSDLYVYILKLFTLKSVRQWSAALDRERERERRHNKLSPVAHKTYRHHSMGEDGHYG